MAQFYSNFEIAILVLYDYYLQSGLIVFAAALLIAKDTTSMYRFEKFYKVNAQQPLAFLPPLASFFNIAKQSSAQNATKRSSDKLAIELQQVREAVYKAKTQFEKTSTARFLEN
uniref:Uncharacterized protein n=1 Tax=Glossina austeni TaxID=7395 RepID=A0A1A9VG10_GLOAU